MILMKDIVRDGDPVLRAVAKPVSFPLSAEDKKLADDMMEYLVNSQDPDIAKKHQLRAGVGLAAPQVGRSIQMAAVLVPDNDGKIILKEVLSNPVITRESLRPAALAEGEGCLSVDEDVPGYVPRHDRVTIRYQDLTGAKKTLRLKDYPAIVCQHEIDHLRGHLFYDHIDKKHPFNIASDAVIVQ
ncbi:peptide deformylase [Schleiferilactobacillus harbinensis]|uniref:peptide deformylase n=1 Tax=Schleiferilactobacillus harbinensis TaxID=304207 RepID=UPI0007B9BFC2|nr:peptide deformylase [Schleiferilactobacillus harbinensis]